MSRRVLVVGAGVLGTLYAGRLALAGHRVSVLARSGFAEIASRGLIWQEGRTLHQARVRAVRGIDPTERYDLVLVLVRNQHLDEVLPVLAVADAGAVVVMVNHAGPITPWRALLAERLVLGFAGAMGVRGPDGLVRARPTARWVQPTTLGDPAGGVSRRIDGLVALFEEAGFPARGCPDMASWLRWHAAVVGPIAAVAERARTEAELRSWAHLGQLPRAWSEGRALLEAAGHPMIPRGLRLLFALPDWLATGLIWLAARLPGLGDQLLAGSAGAPEGRRLCGQLVDLAGPAGEDLPVLGRLARRRSHARSGEER